jgi:ribosomal protein L32
MGEVLSQAEIDQLLTAINAGKDDPQPTTVKEFEEFLSKRNFEPEEPYGIFSNDISMFRFTNTKNGENILADIERKNIEQGMGNIKIPETDITLINFSVCPKCGEIFSFKELMTYYSNPKPDPMYKDSKTQFREDTRVSCSGCGEYFLPSLVISDGTPKNEVQFLCISQTVDAIEKFLMSTKQESDFTKNPKNHIHIEGQEAILNDIMLSDLTPKPTLIVNLLQYTPPKLTLNLLNGVNIEKRDILFGLLNKRHS